MVEDLFMRYKNGYVTFDRMVVLSKIKMFKMLKYIIQTLIFSRVNAIN